jgi:transforming growth factor-beta-induced protein
VETLGGPVTVELEGDNLVVGGATVVTADIEASNGIIHVIDAVITAPAETAPPEQTTTTTTTAPPAAGPATAAPLPTRVDTGNSGLATETTSASVLLAALAGLALMGIGTSTYALARNRRER